MLVMRSLVRVLLIAFVVSVATMPGKPAQSASSGEITVAGSLLRQLFDPAVMSGTYDFTAYDFIYDGLVNLRPEGLVPGLAESWTVSKDGKQVDLNLRKGVRFHNGDPFTAEDVKFTFDRAIFDPKSPYTYKRRWVPFLERVEVIGPHHVRLVLKNPAPTIFTTPRFILPIAPKKYYEKVGAEGFQKKPIGTGPYKLVEFKPGEWNRYEANEDYWAGAPAVKKATWRLVKEPFTRYAMLSRGEADIAMGVTGPLLKRIRSNPKLKIIAARYVATSSLYFNTDIFPEAKDRNVRIAIAHAIDRSAIAKTVHGGLCEASISPFTPSTLGYVKGLKSLGYDPAKAKALLRAAGVKDGHEISFLIGTTSFPSMPNAPQVTEAIAGYLEAIGFKVTRKSYDTRAYIAALRGGKQPSMFYAPASSPNDGGDVFNAYYISRSAWKTRITLPEYDELFNKQSRESNTATRKMLLEKFAKLENEKVTAVPLFWCHSLMAVGPRIKNLRIGQGSEYFLNLRQVEMSQ